MMYRNMNPKQLEEQMKDLKKWKKERDIVSILKDAGYGVVEGKEEVLKKIEEIGGETQSTMPLGFN